MSRGTNMTNIKDSAKNYISPTTKNVAELQEVPVDLDLREEECEDKDGKKFVVKKFTLNDEDYRIPNIVLSQLKDIMESMPNLKTFKVIAKGIGMNVKYTTIPLKEESK